MDEYSDDEDVGYWREEIQGQDAFVLTELELSDEEGSPGRSAFGYHRSASCLLLAWQAAALPCLPLCWCQPSTCAPLLQGCAASCCNRHEALERMKCGSGLGRYNPRPAGQSPWTAEDMEKMAGGAGSDGGGSSDGQGSSYFSGERERVGDSEDGASRQVRPAKPCIPPRPGPDGHATQSCAR